jgi:hypothetical protein
MTAGKTAFYLFKYTTLNIGIEVLSRITLDTRFATARSQVRQLERQQKKTVCPFKTN